MHKNCLPVAILFVMISVPCMLFAGDKVVGYYPSWMQKTLPASQISYQHLTHICHAFAWPEADGRLSMDSDYLYPQLIADAHSAGVTVSFSIGGWGNSGGFSDMAASIATRSAFIRNVGDFIRTNKYDGVDIDWEFPASQIDRHNLTTFVRELRQALDQIDGTILISIAIPSGNWSGQWFDYLALAPFVDWFACMTYDYHGSWTGHAGHNSPLYAPTTDPEGCVHTSFQYLLHTRQLPANKLLLGIPFYGRGFNASRLYDPCTLSTEYQYREIVPLMQAGYDYFWDDLGFVPYLIKRAGTELISFDDTSSVQYKCRYARKQKLAGIMIWALGQDLIAGSEPLLAAVGREMRPDLAIPEPMANQPTRFYVGQNYPNPLNASTTIPFYLATASHVRVDVFDVTGRSMTLLLNSQLEPGWHTIKFDATGVSSGIYFARLTSDGSTRLLKMVSIK